MPKQTIYDVIVVGSGATGGWAAKELTAKGLRDYARSRAQARSRERFQDAGLPVRPQTPEPDPADRSAQEAAADSIEVLRLQKYASHFFVDVQTIHTPLPKANRSIGFAGGRSAAEL